MKRLLSICLILLCSLMPGLVHAEDHSEEQAIDQLVNELSLATG